MSRATFFRFAAVGCFSLTPALALQTTTRLSVSASGVQGNDSSVYPLVSEFGRFVMFSSKATNLVPGDTNGVTDVFVRDLITGAVERVNVDSAGAQADGYSVGTSISRDGRFVGFISSATNLVAGDTNGSVDAFVRDRELGVTVRVSVSSTGAQALGDSSQCLVSHDGRVAAFLSWAGNLVAGDTFGMQDVFVRDLSSGTTTRVSVSATGAEGREPAAELAMSADGRVVAFTSWSANLTPMDDNEVGDVFVVDLTSGTIERILDFNGQDTDHGSFQPALSADGRFLAFASGSDDLIPNSPTDIGPEIWVRDRLTGQTSLISYAQTPTGTLGTWCTSPSISGDGRFVAFVSEANDLVPGDTNNIEDIFLHDRATGTTRRVNLSSLGAQQPPPDPANPPSVSGNGRLVVFHSRANRLVSNDTNGTDDVFLRDEYVGPFAYCTSATTSNGCTPTMSSSGSPSASAAAGFTLSATNVEGMRTGLLFYGVGGAAGVSVALGSTSYLCVRVPVQRTPPQSSGGNAAQCDGALSLDWLAFLASNPNALGQPLAPGMRVNAQAWFRDPPAPGGSNFSNAIEFDTLP